MSYISLALLAALLYSFAGITGKIATKYKISNTNSLVFWLAVTGLVFTPFLWLEAGTIQNPIHYWVPFMLFLTSITVSTYLMWVVWAKIDVSIAQPLFNGQTIFVAVLAYFMLGEKFSPLIYVAIAAIVIGGVLICINEQTGLRSIFNKYILLMILVILLFAISDILARKVLNSGLDPWNLKAWTAVSFFIVFFPLYFIAGPSRKVSAGQLWPLVANNFFNFAASVSVYYAFKQNVTISQALAMFGSFFTLVIVWIVSLFYPLWLEKHTAKVYAIRLLGCALMIAAAVVITLTK